MDLNKPDENLLPFILGAFHTTVFFLLLVIVLYLTGILGPLLDDLNTLIGFAAFALLWALTTWAGRKALLSLAGGQSPQRLLKDLPLPTGPVLAQAAIWGGVTGVLFALAILIVLAVMLGFEVIAVGVIYLAVAFVVGAFAGLLLALLDVLILSQVRRTQTRLNPHSLP